MGALMVDCGPLRGLPAAVWLIALITFVNRAGTMALPFLPLFVSRAGGGDGDAAWSMFAYGAGAMAAMPLAGRAVDRWGPLPVLLGSLMAAGLLVSLIPWSATGAPLLALVCLWGFAAEAVRPASLTAIATVTTIDQRTPAIVLNRFAINVGMAIGPAVGGLLAAGSLSFLFLIDGITAVAAGLVLVVVTRRWSFAALRPTASPRRTGRGVSILTDRRALRFLGAVLLVSFVYAQHLGTLSMYVVEHLRMGPAVYGFLFLLNTALIILLELPVNFRLAAHARLRVIRAGIGFIAIGFGSLGLGREYTALVGSVVIWTFGEMLFYPAATALASEMAPADRLGEYLAAFTMAISAGLLISPLGLAVLSRWGSGAVWGLCALCGLASMAMIGRYDPRPTDSPRLATGRPS